MATRVTLPPLAAKSPMANAAIDDDTSLGDGTPGRQPNPVVPVAKTQLLNDRGDREAEARWLSEAARPGVVQLLSTSTEPFTIVTAHAGSRTMRTARLDPTAGLDLVTEVAELVAGLHKDGFVHGKLTVDHIILGPDGPVLCSPSGAIEEPQSDLAGIARCMRELGRQWDEQGQRTPWRDQWDGLALRLGEGTDPSTSATRTAHALRRMAAARTAIVDVESRRIPTGVALAAVGVLVAIAGLAFAPTGRPTAATGPLVEIDGSTYAVGTEGDDVAHLPDSCDPAVGVIVLRPTTGELWAFNEVGDGASSLPIAIVPGAKELRREVVDERSCDIAVARGPAGATVIDTVALRNPSNLEEDLTVETGE